MTASSCGSTRLAETILSLAIGVGTNLVVATAVSAAPIRLNIAELTNLASVSGAAGGLVAAMVHFAGVVLSPPAEGRTRNVASASVEAVFAVLVGAIAGNYLAVPVAAGLPFVPVSSAPVAGFGIGVFAWQTAPGVIGGAKLFASPRNVAASLGRWLSSFGGGEPK